VQIISLGIGGGEGGSDKLAASDEMKASKGWVQEGDEREPSLSRLADQPKGDQIEGSREK